MKLNAGKRVLMFFHWLFSLLICAAFALYIIKPDLAMQLYNMVFAGLTQTQVMIIGIAVLALFTILTVVQACLIFHRGKRADRGFITVDSSDNGRVRIAVPAIEQMVRQSVYNIDGISDMKIAIENMDDAIAINIAATIINGSHVPTITMNMQRAIRQFVETNCGVAVRTVSININGVSGNADTGRRKRRGKGEPAQPVIEPVQPAAYPSYPTQEPEKVPEPEPAPAYQAPAPAYQPSEPEPEETVEIPEVRPIRLTLDPTPDPAWGESEAPSTEAAEEPERLPDEE